ncbi:ferrous iron transport protein B [Candidatus Hakubella thermalkaliphila]|uniref:Ferrous iron transport protein B n=4 Tax=Candidatus Hakubella thermalkaliphila TaxID=2754717 RepID=A0A6V8PXY8_9ACTN|nr:ferrous iron transport protein B [Candidatus Hakubella thermalkaliphila]GFP29192.1 ferrous iron transport protein B [Candidatus Hakubella thermalkaliphila]GFP36664.1 ferrous iron transport protein B [Candidatus Hakubella thermalkaliphila]GFP39402.1 ferrous iron transport protein B [Candidatus Hakubella thermalkaliphila]GFP42399.1 ferrous iron transport protein B [Candidatus Hakubella thermalkaliphila]
MSQTVVSRQSSVGSQVSERKTITVAVAGNPNSGKSTLINAIVGTRLHVGNWPGVTVEKKEAMLEYEGRKIKFVDLPGAYSLSPYTQEEIIARDYLVHEKPDVIIDIVDATNLERNLYLTVQMMELGIPIVIALNIYDEAEKKGYKIDTKAMEEALGVRVIPTVSTKKKGLDDLLKAIIEVADAIPSHLPNQLNYGQDIEDASSALQMQIKNAYPALAEKYPLRWLSFKLMEGDDHVYKEINIAGNGLPVRDVINHLKKAHGDDIESIMADARYAQATGLTHEVLKKPEFRKIDLTEKIDRVVLNRFLGIPIFLAAMWVVFKLVFDVSTPFIDWVDEMMAGPFPRWAEAILGVIHAPAWTVSLATDGVIAGVGFVLVFVPIIFAMMFAVTFLEGSGYMARAAFVMDRAMHAMGLHGKSFIPMLLGFGCNVPSIYATRTLENPKDKVLTALIVPLMSCGARLPVYVLFIGAFFAARAGTVIWSLYVLGIAMAVVMGVIFKRTLFKGEAPMFIMELPPYRMPSFRSLMIHTWEKGRHFLIKAGTYILAVSILIWFLLNLPWGVEHKKDSFLGQAGQVVAPVFEPLGFGNWEAASALITGVIAKEIVVGTMGEIYIPGALEEEEGETPTLGEDLKEIGTSFIGAFKGAVVNVFSSVGVVSLAAGEDEPGPMRTAMQKAFTPLSAFAFMVFTLLYMPCVIVMIALRHEFVTWRWSVIAFLYLMILAWVVTFVVYQGGRLLGFE